ncbi:hypothetical protein [Arsukibacterium sp.]|uniref:hypothetical protein n=1 Tax=Arsukibacterium sp. TaxID=1977258 RepID=UPI00299ED034|nr:hypothetical protein [Arsukibacterium sp.]MDX1539270.1 hypothetical protein [Arsukibacterium sp.]
MAANKKSSGVIFNNAERWPKGFAPWMAANKKSSGVIFNNAERWPIRVFAMDGSK